MADWQVSAELQAKIRRRPDLWREVCVRSLELLEGTDKHVDAVLTLYRDPRTTRQQFQAAYTAAYAANAAYAAYAASNRAKLQRFIADLFLLVEFAPKNNGCGSTTVGEQV